MDSAFGVDNLLALVFINVSGEILTLSSESLQDRAEGITFFRILLEDQPN